MRLKLLLLAVVVAVVGVVYIFSQQKKNEPQTRQELLAEEAATSSETELSEVTLEDKPLGPGSNRVLKTPTLEQVRDEVDQNPHSTPPSIIEFADRLASKFEDATVSQKKAENLFYELENCVKQDTRATAPAIMALCLANAEELSEIFPGELTRRYVALEEAAPREVKDLFNAEKSLRE